jgi:cysteine desulfurase / selenocysteine lyase
VDGAQSAPHLSIDVQALGCDFFVFSGHKLLGPFGSGALWGRRELLEEIPPYNVGGGSVESASLERAEFKGAPKRFEGGTDNPAGAVGFSAAVKMLRTTGSRRILEYERRLTEHGLEVLLSVPGLNLLGSPTPEDRLPIFSFTLEGYSGQELAKKLGNRGIAVSGGSLNASPLLRRFGLDEATRASCYIYNTTEELDALAAALMELSTAS